MSFGFGEVLIIGAIILLLFGAKKLPALGKAAREAINNFKKGKDGEDEETQVVEAKEIEKTSKA